MHSCSIFLEAYMTNFLPEINQKPIQSFLTEERLKTIAADDSKIKKLFTIFLEEREQYFILNNPKACCDLLPVLSDQLAKGTITKEFARKVALVFASYNTFFETNIENDILIQCKDNKTIKINSRLLRLHSDYFDAIFSSTMKEANEKCIDYSNEYRVETLELFQIYLYQGLQAFTDRLLYVQDLSLLTEFYQFSDYIQMRSTFQNALNQALDQRADAVASKKDLEEIVRVTKQGSGTQKRALLSYFRSSGVSYHTKPLSISITAFGLLDEQSVIGELARAHIKGFAISTEDELEDIKFLEFMSEEIRNGIEHAVFGYAPSEQMLQIVGQLFPQIKRLYLPQTLIKKHQLMTSYNPSSKLSISLREISETIQEIKKNFSSMKHIIVYNIEGLAKMELLSLSYTAASLMEMKPALLSQDLEVSFFNPLNNNIDIEDDVISPLPFFKWYFAGNYEDHKDRTKFNLYLYEDGIFSTRLLPNTQLVLDV
jgi:hypothetical protein